MSEQSLTLPVMHHEYVLLPVMSKFKLCLQEASIVTSWNSLGGRTVVIFQVVYSPFSKALGVCFLMASTARVELAGQVSGIGIHAEFKSCRGGLTSEEVCHAGQLPPDIMMEAH